MIFGGLCTAFQSVGKNWIIFVGALGRAALFQLASVSASGALEKFSERERERTRKIRERLILCQVHTCGFVLMKNR